MKIKQTLCALVLAGVTVVSGCASQSYVPQSRNYSLPTIKQVDEETLEMREQRFKVENEKVVKSCKNKVYLTDSSLDAEGKQFHKTSCDLLLGIKKMRPYVEQIGKNPEVEKYLKEQEDKRCTEDSLMKYDDSCKK